jgi:hypothetical protein
MRRLDLQPKKKLRNPGRHLRQLARWPDRITEQIPDAAAMTDQLYWNFKIPVTEKLIDPSRATDAVRKGCLAALFAAAEAVERSPRRPLDCRVACLATTPFLFQSEVTMFLSEDYFRRFLPASGVERTTYSSGWVESEPADAALLTPIRPPEPSGLAFLGGTRFIEFDAECPGQPVDYIQWIWAYPSRL